MLFFFSLSVISPFAGKENPFLQALTSVGPASNHPNGKGDKKSSVNHKDPSNSFKDVESREVLWWQEHAFFCWAMKLITRF